MNIKETLRVIVADPHLHARWLNSLAYLEYRGFRKIVRSRTTDEMSLEVLMHTAEEVRHALFFKKSAVKVGGSSFATFAEFSLLCPDSLKSYFYEIDRGASLAIGGLRADLLSGAAYSLVTWLVEKRALSIYQEYERVLKAAGENISVASILREENSHLQEIGAEAEHFLARHDFDVQQIASLEENEFHKLWRAIKACVHPLRTEARV